MINPKYIILEHLIEIGGSTAEKNNGRQPSMEISLRYGYKILFLQQSSMTATDAS